MNLTLLFSYFIVSFFWLLHCAFSYSCIVYLQLSHDLICSFNFDCVGYHKGLIHDLIGSFVLKIVIAGVTELKCVKKG